MCCGGKRLIPGKWVLVLTGTQESHSVTRVAPNKTLTRRVQGPRPQECRCAEWRSVLPHPLLWLVSSPGREKQGLCLSRGPVSAACVEGSGGRMFTLAGVTPPSLWGLCFKYIEFQGLSLGHSGCLSPSCTHIEAAFNFLF